MRPRRGAAVPRIESLSHVGVFTRNRERAEAFYTRKVGLVVRGRPADAGLRALGTTRAGEGRAGRGARGGGRGAVVEVLRRGPELPLPVGARESEGPPGGAVEDGLRDDPHAGHGRVGRLLPESPRGAC